MKVLLVEDDGLMVKMYLTILKNSGVEVETARNGKEGIEKAKSLLPDVIMADVMMPGSSGVELLEAVKSDAKTKAIPVVILSNLAGGNDKELLLSKGASAYWVKKDIEPKQVVVELKKIVGK